MKDTVRDQKVFVPLSSVIELARRYDIICNGLRDTYVGDLQVNPLRVEKQTLEMVIDKLGLPIAKRAVQPKEKK